MKSITISILLLTLSGCQWEGRETKSDSTAIIAVDGSSTVFPIAEAVAEEFGKTHKVRVTIGVSGSGARQTYNCLKWTDPAISNGSMLWLTAAAQSFESRMRFLRVLRPTQSAHS